MNRILNIHSHLHGDRIHPETIYSFTEDKVPTHFNGYKSIGVHPWDIENKDYDFTSLEAHAQEINTLAIGEAGLDKNIPTPIAVQEEIFIKHIELSEKYKKPLIIHNVRSTPEILKLHKQFKPTQTWIVHGFRGKPALYQEYQRAGIMVSIGSKFNTDTISILSTNQILVETDDSEESIQNVIEAIAERKKITPQELIDQIYKNTSRIFFH